MYAVAALLPLSLRHHWFTFWVAAVLLLLAVAWRWPFQPVGEPAAAGGRSRGKGAETGTTGEAPDLGTAAAWEGPQQAAAWAGPQEAAAWAGHQQAAESAAWSAVAGLGFEQAPEESCTGDEAPSDSDPAHRLASLLDRAFSAKNMGAWSAAAELFVQALELEPPPDVAYYLIADAYRLWCREGAENYACNRLARYWQAYRDHFDESMRQSLAARLTGGGEQDW